MSSKVLTLAVVVLLALMALASGILSAASGDELYLDPSFGRGGKVLANIGSTLSHGFAVVVLPDGRIVQGGGAGDNFGLAAYTTNGRLDPDFGSDQAPGLVAADFHGLHDTGIALTTQPDGKIVQVGFSFPNDASSFAVARYNSDGTLDASFGAAGRAEVQFYTDDNGTAVALQPDGKIVLAGTTFSATLRSPLAIARLNPDGSPDNSFNDDGKATLHVPGTWGNTADVVVLADGKVLVAGSASPARNSSGQFALARFDANGNPDPLFGSGGVVSGEFCPNGGSSGKAMAVQPDGKIVVVGEVFCGPAAVGAARYNSDGSLDATFGVNGRVTLQLASRLDTVSDIVLDAAGRILIAGQGGAFADAKLALARLLADGRLDPAFGQGGTVLTDVGPGAELAAALALQPDGKIVVSGGAAGTFLLARYADDGRLDPGFGSGGIASATFPDYTDKADAFAGQPDGKLLLGSMRGTDWRVLRFNADGSPDMDFGAAGSVTYTLPDPLMSQATSMRLAVGSGGTVVTGGTVYGQGSGTDGCTSSVFALLLRYNPDGSPDPSFGTAGAQCVAVGGSFWLDALLVQPDDKIVLAGSSGFVVRLNPDGSFDQSFGQAGVIFGNGPYFDAVNGVLSLTLQQDGKILVGGSCVHGPCVARYNQDGSFDQSFGQNGLMRLEWEDRYYLAFNYLVPTPAGKILAGIGLPFSDAPTGPQLLSLNPDGSIDTRFGNAGMISTPLQLLRGLTITADGTILAAGDVDGDFALAAYNPDGSPRAEWGAAGLVTSDIGGAKDTVTGMALQPDRKVVLAGTSNGMFGNDPAMIRYTLDRQQPTPTIGPGCIFADVCAGDFFYGPVQQLLSAGVLSGYGDNTFRPHNSATRGQVSKVVVLAAGLSIDTVGGPHFADVPSSNPFYGYIETAYNRGIIGGYEDGTFRWNQNVTRGQLAKIVVLAASWTPQTGGVAHFGDVPTDNAFYGYIESAYEHGIISGYEDGTFRWWNATTSGQIAKVVALANNVGRH